MLPWKSWLHCCMSVPASARSFFCSHTHTHARAQCHLSLPPTLLLQLTLLNTPNNLPLKVYCMDKTLKFDVLNSLKVLTKEADLIFFPAAHLSVGRSLHV